MIFSFPSHSGEVGSPPAQMTSQVWPARPWGLQRQEAASAQKTSWKITDRFFCFFSCEICKHQKKGWYLIPDTSLETSRKPCLLFGFASFWCPNSWRDATSQQEPGRGQIGAGDWIRTATACWNTSLPLGTGGSDDHPTDRPGEEVPVGRVIRCFNGGITVQHLAILASSWSGMILQGVSY